MKLYVNKIFNHTTLELKNISKFISEIHIQSQPKYFRGLLFITIIEVALFLSKPLLLSKKDEFMFQMITVVISLILFLFLLFLVLEKKNSAVIQFNLKTRIIIKRGGSDIFEWDRIKIPKNVMLIKTFNIDNHKVLLPSHRGFRPTDKRRFYRIYLVEIKDLNNVDEIAEYVSRNYYPHFQSERSIMNNQIKTFIQTEDALFVKYMCKLLEMIFDKACSETTIYILS